MERTLRIEKEYLIFPVDTREELQDVHFVLDGETLYDVRLRLAKKANLFTWLHVAPWRGHKLQLQCDTADESLLELVKQSDKRPDESTCYREKLRPRLHYTQRVGWVNDPNGMVWCNGRYHLFYQHNPYDTRWENMHWGHAVSSDLVHWQEKEECLYPDKSGTMFSGCAVMDTHNVSGLGTEQNPPMLLYYTAAGGANRVSAGKDYTVCLAYSTDNGETFAKYEGNPVLPNYCFGNRDPKIIWHAPSGRFIMTLFLQAYDFAFYSSEDLLHWKYESESSFPPLNECPDLFPLAGTDRWVLLAGSEYWGNGSVGQYYLGDFDGSRFHKQAGPYPIDFGKEFYSLQTFDNEPQGRRILMGWRTRNFHTPERQGMPFNGEFSLPTQLTPCTIDGNLRIARMPVQAFFDYAPKARYTYDAPEYSALRKDLPIFAGLKAEALCIRLEMTLQNNAMVEFDLGGHVVTYSSETQTLQCLGKNVSVPLENGRLRLVLVRDVVSLEIFAQDGKYPAGGYVEPHNGKNALTLYRGNATDCKIEVRLYDSIWQA